MRHIRLVTGAFVTRRGVILPSVPDPEKFHYNVYVILLNPAVRNTRPFFG